MNSFPLKRNAIKRHTVRPASTGLSLKGEQGCAPNRQPGAVPKRPLERVALDKGHSSLTF